jgi:hypothetical protein
VVAASIPAAVSRPEATAGAAAAAGLSVIMVGSSMRGALPARGGELRTVAASISCLCRADSGSLGGCVSIVWALTGPRFEWAIRMAAGGDGGAQPFSVASSKARSSWKCRSVASGL